MTVIKSLGDLFRFDHQLAGFLRIGHRSLHDPLRPLVATMLRAHGLQLAEAAHVALAPSGYAIAQPVLLAFDRLAELVLLQFFRLEHLIAPGSKWAKPRSSRRDIPRSSQTVAVETFSRKRRSWEIRTSALRLF
ncbi:hypothetical protein AJ87_33910 [Rhizobium yanglingense]|nr:hypothetical protein AJ87_33910 [Rhizobium yanglingense]